MASASVAVHDHTVIGICSVAALARINDPGEGRDILAERLLDDTTQDSGRTPAPWVGLLGRMFRSLFAASRKRGSMP